MTRYDVRHRTEYAYALPVALSHHLLHLEPRATAQQRVHAHGLTIEPLPSWSDRRQDAFGNPARAVTVASEHSSLLIEARSTVEVDVPAPPKAETTPAWETIAAACATADMAGALGAARFAFASPFTATDDAIEAFARESFAPGRPALDAALDLNRRIHEQFAYDPSATTVATPVADVLRLRRGVCQDFAHLMLAALRSLGLPARYVSGYLLTRPPPGQERLIGADASHAWAGFWLPDAGWIDLDPTNDRIAGDEHVTLAWGRDYGDVSPVAGVVYGGGAHVLHVAVDVVPIAEAAEAPSQAG